MIRHMLNFHVHIAATEQSVANMASFDAALAALALLPRLFIEPDGSFVWTGDAHGRPWQVDGNLIDRGDCLAYVELKGFCPEESLTTYSSLSVGPTRPWRSSCRAAA